jgi:ketosteroid isomerase-like protein
MSAATVELVYATYAAWERGDIEWLVAHSDPDIEIVQPPELPDSKSYWGYAGVRDMFEDWPKQWDDFRVELLEVIDISDTQAISVTRHYLRAREMDLAQDFSYLHTLRNGKGIRFRDVPHAGGSSQSSVLRVGSTPALIDPGPPPLRPVEHRCGRRCR